MLWRVNYRVFNGKYCKNTVINNASEGVLAYMDNQAK